MTVYDFTVKTIKGEHKSLQEYEGKVLLVVNVASKCGFTPQYKGLQALYEEYKEQGLEILGFPCNQFLGQEPGNSEEIASFCEMNYGVTFPMFEKIEVNGDGAHPLYKYLCEEAPGMLGLKAVKWNFTKFLVDQKGNVLERFSPQTAPEEIAPKLVELLAEK
ncbi:glutathione peroxidase [Ectobacillus sp. sgz5001026]|uniref:glutathione peroxidase n=1 Tax=Ectobacillus sp. sgz5001026 TaxID=3242473 RepID=UPI0036D27025